MNQINAVCITCQKSKAQLQCGLCRSAICKYCAIILEDESFAFLNPRPAELSHESYCNPCFNSTVAEPLARYNSNMEKAKNINVYLKKQAKETRLMKRIEDPVVVNNCPDELETMMRLAFHAAEAGFNGLIDVEIINTKVRDGAYQTTTWSGSGIPANVKK